MIEGVAMGDIGSATVGRRLPPALVDHGHPPGQCAGQLDLDMAHGGRHHTGMGDGQHRARIVQSPQAQAGQPFELIKVVGHQIGQ